MERRLDSGTARGARQAPRSPPLSCQKRAGRAREAEGSGAGGAAGRSPFTWLPAVGAAAIVGPGGPLQLQQQRLVAVAVHHRCLVLGAELCGRLSPGRQMRNWSAAPAPRAAPFPPAPTGGCCSAAPQAASWRRLPRRSGPGAAAPRQGPRRRRAGPAR